MTHDEDGYWQLLCGTTNKSEDGRVACLGDLFERDRTIGALADLPRGGGHGGNQSRMPGNANWKNDWIRSMGSACRAFSILGGFEIRRATLGGGRVRGGGEGVENLPRL